MPPRRTFRKNRLVWVDANIDEKKADTRETLEKFKSVIDDVTPFRRIEQCVQFLQRNNADKIFVVSSGSFGLELVQQINEMPQVDSIYIFCGDRARHRSWASSWSKIKLVDTDIDSICEALKQANADSNPDRFSIDNDQDEVENDRNQLDAGYMYTKLFKRIFLDMDNEPNERKAFVKHCRSLYRDNPHELEMIDEFDQKYRPDRAIWWYTSECFLYQTVNRALRLQQYDLIVDMGFFLRDFHRQLEYLHREQFDSNHGQNFTLFRSQILSEEDFAKLKNNVGGLIAFNNFCTTSLDRGIAMAFLQRWIENDERLNVLITITVNSSIGSSIFAEISSCSSYAREEEFIFSMNTVFHIDRIDQSDKKGGIINVHLTWTDEEDPELRLLADVIERDLRGKNPFDQMARLLIQVGQFNKAEELYQQVLEQRLSEQEQADYYQQLGLIKVDQGNYREAIKYYERATSINENMRSRDSPLALCYEKLGVAYMKMKEYSKALEFLNKALILFQKVFPEWHPYVALCYSNIGEVYLKLNADSKALGYFNQALDIQVRSVPPMHPDLARTYENLGRVYQRSKDYNKALSYYQKARRIYQRVLPAGHDRTTNLMKSIEEVKSV